MIIVRFKTDDSISNKGFMASYIAVEPPELDPLNEYDELASTPFPGYMKSVFIQDYDYYDEDKIYSIDQKRKSRNKRSMY